jgi:hypothetical protein
MHHAVVWNSQQFLGFMLCKSLLEKGYEVIAFDQQEWLRDYHEEKWLEVGRNANISFWESEEANRIDAAPSTICFIPIYDFYIEYDKRVMEKWKHSYQAFLNKNRGEIEKIVWIAPKQFLESNQGTQQKLQLSLDSIFRDDSNAVNEVRWYYVPTLFGPWQPNTLLFQQIIQNGCRMEEMDYLDDTFDALFIETAVNFLIDHVKIPAADSHFVLQNKEAGSWDAYLSLLGVEKFTKGKPKEILNHAVSLFVDEEEPFVNHIMRQRQWWEMQGKYFTSFNHLSRSSCTKK